MIIPATVTQYESYSDIEERTVNYDHLMLDIEKTWYVEMKKKQQLYNQMTNIINM
jgi:hypothetical protein